MNKFLAQICWVQEEQICYLLSNAKYICSVSTLFGLISAIFANNVSMCAFLPIFLFVSGEIAAVPNRTNILNANLYP